MLRLGFLYSFVMTLAGSPLLAENPDDAQQPNSVAPALMMPLLAENTGDPQPTLAQPAVEVDLQPTPADGVYQVRTASLAEASQPEPTLELLRQKQQQFDELQHEIGAMQRQLGVAAQYQVQCIMGEVNLDKLRELDPEIQWDDQRLSLVRFLENADQNRTIPVQQFRAIEMCLNQTGAMKTLMSPSLVTSSGLPAMVSSGGQFPKPNPVGKITAVSPVSWQPYGVSLQADVQTLSAGRVKIHVVPECSELDHSQAIEVNGHEVPGLLTQRMDIHDEIQIGKTLVRSVVSLKENKPTCLLVGVTVTAVEPAVPVAERPELLPIPEADAIKLK